VKLCNGHSEGDFEGGFGGRADHQSGGVGFVAPVSSQIAFTLTAVQTKLLPGKMYSLSAVNKKCRKLVGLQANFVVTKHLSKYIFIYLKD